MTGPTPSGHADCAETIRQGMADLGCEVTVSTTAPVVDGPFTHEGMTCPHGTTFWFEPTGEQIAAWARDGVR